VSAVWCPVPGASLWMALLLVFFKGMAAMPAVSLW